MVQEVKWSDRQECVCREMKIQCEVCEKAPATVICCSDEAALCAQCDIAVHSANKLADICQEKPAFIFYVEDRALICQDCDGPLHLAGSLSANHQRLLSTGSTSRSALWMLK